MRSGIAFGLISLLAGVCFAQRGPGMRPNSMPLGNPLPPLRPIPPAGGSPRPPVAPQRGMRSNGFYSLPYFPASYYPGPYSDSAPPGPSVTIIQQFAPPPVVVEEVPVTPQIREYPAPAAAPPSGSEPATFTIALKDGSVLTATAVMTQGNALQIVDSDGQHRTVPLDAIDREATRRRNAENNLRLQLPPPSAR
jgi:hypothetical protein